MRFRQVHLDFHTSEAGTRVPMSSHQPCGSCPPWVSGRRLVSLVPLEKSLHQRILSVASGDFSFFEFFCASCQNRSAVLALSAFSVAD